MEGADEEEQPLMMESHRIKRSSGEEEEDADEAIQLIPIYRVARSGGWRKTFGHLNLFPTCVTACQFGRISACPSRLAVTAEEPY